MHAKTKETTTIIRKTKISTTHTYSTPETHRKHSKTSTNTKSTTTPSTNYPLPSSTYAKRTPTPTNSSFSLSDHHSQNILPIPISKSNWTITIIITNTYKNSFRNKPSSKSFDWNNFMHGIRPIKNHRPSAKNNFKTIIIIQIYKRKKHIQPILV